MKLAVIFLCVALASFIDTSNGFGKANTFDKTKAEFYVRSCQSVGQKVEILKTCPEHEKETRKKCILEDLCYLLDLLCVDLDCTLEQVLKITGLPLDIVNCILNGNLEAILSLTSNIDVIITPVLCLVEGVLGNCGILLKNQLLVLNNLLGSVMGLFSCFTGLQGTLAGVLSTPISSLLGGLPSLLTPALGSLTNGILGKGLLGI
ncbi:uncharacterized protein [Phyllobates terribilis]|uniref:uncharacterized protein n=1 Tax=Phyllobates terribilis TaxID=111132 RepID=UPI003CCADC4B